MSDHVDHVRRNRAYWNTDGNAVHGPLARGRWAAEPCWGLWARPESELHLLPDDVAGLDVIELGCGTGYVSAWLSRAGARPVGIDISERQLATAREMQAEFGIEFPLVQADAERVPYPDHSFDLAISEYGASLWCDPHRWIPEAARLLRPGGRLMFLRPSTVFMLCAPDEGAASAELVRPQRDLHRIDWGAEIEFALPHGELVGVLRSAGFTVEDLIEIYAPEQDPDLPYRSPYVTADWARRWPNEEVWKARLAG